MPSDNSSAASRERKIVAREHAPQNDGRGHQDGTIRPDVTAWTVARFGAMLAQPLPAGPIQEEGAAEQRRIFLRGVSV